MINLRNESNAEALKIAKSICSGDVAHPLRWRDGDFNSKLTISDDQRTFLFSDGSSITTPHTDDLDQEWFYDINRWRSG